MAEDGEISRLKPVRDRNSGKHDAFAQWSLGGDAGSNKVAVNPDAGAVIQRRARPRPNACAFPVA